MKTYFCHICAAREKKATATTRYWSLKGKRSTTFSFSLKINCCEAHEKELEEYHEAKKLPKTSDYLIWMSNGCVVLK